MANRAHAYDLKPTPEPDAYLAAHVREALAQDPRLGELGIEVEIVGGAVVLRGSVASPERRSAAEVVARDVLPERRIRNETDVVPVPEPTDVEHLP